MLIYADFDPAGSGVGAGLGWGIAAVACLREGGIEIAVLLSFSLVPDELPVSVYRWRRALLPATGVYMAERLWGS